MYSGQPQRPSPRTFTRPNTAASRRGISWIGTVAGVVTLLALPIGGWMYVVGPTSQELKVITHQVSRGRFQHDVTEPGEIESSANVEIRCEVRSRSGGSGGTAIIEIVPEGSLVEEGDFLLKFDSSALESELLGQQIIVNTSKATVIQAQSMYDTAVISLKEYLQGTFRQEEETLEGEILVAKENLSVAQEYLKYSELLHSKGYLTAQQLDADRFAVEKALSERKIGETKLDVLGKFTKEKMVLQFEADIATTEAALASEKSSHQLDVEKLEEIQTQIEKCEVRAPSAGQVVYANSNNRRGGEEIIIEEGTTIRERQVVIRLPNSDSMQVRAKINESRIDLIKEGMRASIRVDAFQGDELSGIVTKIDAFPMPGSWYSSNIKEYGTTISIDSVSDNLRPGMTAEVEIHVETANAVISVPVQTVFEHGSIHYCVVKNDNKLEARTITIGSTNDKYVVVEAGLEDDVQVVLNPRNYLEDIILPEIEEPETETQLARADGKPAQSKKKRDGKAGEGKEGKSKAGAEKKDGDKKGPGQGESGGKRDPRAMAQSVMAGMDKNSDGKIARDEWPADRADKFDPTDTNSDGSIDAGEFQAAMKKVVAATQAGGRPSGGSSGPGS
jgi:HlyD family secretion protein